MNENNDKKNYENVIPINSVSVEGKKKCLPELSNERLTVNEKIQMIKVFLSSSYEIIYNNIKGKYFWKRKNSNDHIRELLDRDENSIIIKIMESIPQIGKLPGDLFRRILESDFIPIFDYFKEYFLRSNHNEGRYIEQLASTITPVSGQEERWRLYFRKWLIASVATMLGEDINHTCLILSGKQGLGKGKWIEKLVLDPMYFHIGPVNPGSKDSKILLSEMQLIYIDELESVTKGEWAKIKSLLTLATINVRRPYGRRTENLIRRASFCGSLNSPEILTDLTGNRRWLIVEVEKINFEFTTELVHNALMEAYHAYREGEIYWFNEKEIDFINQNNENYLIPCHEEELLLKYFEPISIHEFSPETCFKYSNSELLTLLKNRNPGVSITSKKLGSILQKYKFVKQSITGGSKKYLVRVKSDWAYDFVEL